jgi:hypothetical protein
LGPSSSHGNSDADPSSHIDSHFDILADDHTNPDRYVHRYRHTDRNLNPLGYPDVHGQLHPDADSHPDGYSHAHSYTELYTHAH